MKRILLAITFLGATFFTDVYAQFTGGSAGRQTVPAPATTTKTVTDKGAFDNAFYIRVGQSSPKGQFGALPTMDKSARDSFNGQDGSGAQKGIVAEMGLISYFQDIPLAEQFKLGLDVNLAFASHKLDWSSMDANYDNEMAASMVFAGLKIGPAFSYNPVGKLIFDVFFKVNPGISSAPEIYYYESKDLNNSYSYTLSNDGTPAFSVRKSLGLNVRYSALMVGMEYNYGNVKYSLYEDYYGQVNGTSFSNFDTFEVETPTSMLLLTAGFKF
jgi:hypothetical protein